MADVERLESGWALALFRGGTHDGTVVPCEAFSSSFALNMTDDSGARGRRSKRARPAE